MRGDQNCLDRAIKAYKVSSLNHLIDALIRKAERVKDNA